MQVVEETAKPRVTVACADYLGGQFVRLASAVGVAGLCVKVTALLKEVVVAGVYGRSDATDAFLLALLLPNLLVNVVAESTNQALIPALVQVRMERGLAEARAFLWGAMMRLSVALTVCAGALACFAPWVLALMAGRFSESKVVLSISLCRAMAPLVLLAGLAAVCSAALNTLQEYSWPALAPALSSISILLGTACLGPWIGIWALAIATVVGGGLHAGALFWRVQRSALRTNARRYRRSSTYGPLGRQVALLASGSLISCAGVLVDQTMAAWLISGSLATLVFAGRYVSTALMLLAGGVSTASAPLFSSMVARGDWDSCRFALRSWKRRSALFAIPVAALLMLGAKWIVSLTLQHGNFHAGDSAAVAPVLAMCALQIPFVVVSRVDYRFLLATRRADLVLYCGLISLAMNVGLDLLLMRWMGVAGIALSTSIWSMASWGFLRFCATRELRRCESARPMKIPA